MATQYLFRSEAPHVSALEEMFQVVTEVGDVGVHRDLGGEGGRRRGGKEGMEVRGDNRGRRRKEEGKVGEGEKSNSHSSTKGGGGGRGGGERGNIMVLHPTLFSHSNSAHIFLNSASVHEAGWM